MVQGDTAAACPAEADGRSTCCTERQEPNFLRARCRYRHQASSVAPGEQQSRARPSAGQCYFHILPHGTSGGQRLHLLGRGGRADVVATEQRARRFELQLEDRVQRLVTNVVEDVESRVVYNVV